ncbi:hypothetical protein BDV96DRAFT_594956 [Lophiotrema nucula]|uniref:N-acetyltransferase domain-containing protein n=1 Tax=Lophiotrema nucula TaxID=690887 RepID=A0A6A5ZQI0_9PLEO|nr:hypothetical protein BDV96DRAFT_594956 [Lophiotrema nucula]
MSSYTVHLLPRKHSNSAIWTSIIAKQKALRLQSLQIAPEAFSSTYEREIAFKDEEWEKRLQNPSAHTFAVVKTHEDEDKGDEITEKDDEDGELVEGEWVGMSVLFGPLSSDNGKIETGKKVIFEIFGLFVLPDKRGLGLGKKLVDAAVEHGKVLGKEQKAEEVVVRIRAVPTNKSVVTMYETLGFKIVEIVRVEGKNDGTVSMELKSEI